MVRQFTPEEAVERYIEERRSDLSDSTVYNYRSNLGMFTDWCSYQSEIDHVRDIDQFHISDFKIHKRDDDEVADTTLYNVMMSLRVFVKWCESKGLLKDMAENILLPDRGRAARTETIAAKTGEQILDFLEKYEYATYKHAMFALLWDCGFRLGGVRAIDLQDYHSAEAYLELRHRPEKGTPLKNKKGSEREVNLHEWVVDVLNDYIEGRRHAVTDDHGRDPLLTTKQGRPARTTLRRHIRALTRPCHYSDECPIGRNEEGCEGTEWGKAQKCPESVRPHSIRRSSITAWLDDGHSKELVSDRMDVSPGVLEDHYDQRSKEQKRRLRREMFKMDE
jgi:site-specific recombinase XerD